MLIRLPADVLKVTPLLQTVHLETIRTVSLFIAAKQITQTVAHILRQQILEVPAHQVEIQEAEEGVNFFKIDYY